jgi:hypothetical protein
MGETHNPFYKHTYPPSRPISVGFFPSPDPPFFFSLPLSLSHPSSYSHSLAQFRDLFPTKAFSFIHFRSSLFWFLTPRLERHIQIAIPLLSPILDRSFHIAHSSSFTHHRITATLISIVLLLTSFTDNIQFSRDLLLFFSVN